MMSAVGFEQVRDAPAPLIQQSSGRNDFGSRRYQRQW